MALVTLATGCGGRADAHPQWTLQDYHNALAAQVDPDRRATAVTFAFHGGWPTEAMRSQLVERGILIHRRYVLLQKPESWKDATDFLDLATVVHGPSIEMKTTEMGYFLESWLVEGEDRLLVAFVAASYGESAQEVPASGPGSGFLPALVPENRQVVFTHGAITLEQWDRSELKGTARDEGVLHERLRYPPVSVPAIVRTTDAGTVAWMVEPDGEGWEAWAVHGDGVWAVTDHQIESPGWDVTLYRIVPTDQERIAVIRKPSYLAWVVSIEAIDQGGVGMVIHLDDDTAEVPGGDYRIEVAADGTILRPWRRLQGVEKHPAGG